MSRVSVKEILQYATIHKFGVPAINVFNYETVKWAIEGAEREKLPIIIQVYPGFSQHINLKYIADFTKDMAQKATVPVAVHLDHSTTYEIAVAGIRDGFPSVMIDGSSHPYEENVQLTKEVIKVARIFDVDIEAELGHVGTGSKLEDIIDSNNYTSVQQAVEFVERTDCDSLAVAVGNAHGVYIKEPNLDFERIAKIRSSVSIPLVLHGCSDIPDEQIQKSVNFGISKFNIATEYDRAFYHAICNSINPSDNKGSFFRLETAACDEIKAFVIRKLKLLNPNNYSL
ncbi:MAG: fructose,6-bisphosphate aldolase, class [Herbinix sp.]|jgi:ketose-bisphosphate aldolase|nr:fructose,6-bisphosphate aldolase, class [Herbinix sp.]